MYTCSCEGFPACVCVCVFFSVQKAALKPFTAHANNIALKGKPIKCIKWLILLDLMKSFLK